MRCVSCFVLITLLPIVASGEGPAFTYTHVCRASIATNNGHDPKLIKVTSSKGNLVAVSYQRPSDSKRFRFWCLIEESEVKWKDEYIPSWATNTRLYYRISENEMNLEVRSVITGEENTPIVRTFEPGDL